MQTSYNREVLKAFSGLWCYPRWRDEAWQGLGPTCHRKERRLQESCKRQRSRDRSSDHQDCCSCCDQHRQITEKCFHWEGSHLLFLLLLVTNWCSPKKAVTSPALRGESIGKVGRKTMAALLSGKSVITVNCLFCLSAHRTGPDQFQFRKTWIRHFKSIDFQNENLSADLTWNCVNSHIFFWVQWELNLPTFSDA